MIINADLDKVIYAIVQDCGTVSPPLGASEIEEIAVEQIETQMRGEIKASLGRLVDQGQLVQIKAEVSQRYYVAQESAA